MTRRRHTGLPRRRCAGMTLLELLISTAATALIAGAVAAMISATTYGTSSERDLRSLVVKHKTTSGRLSAALRGAKMVLEVDDNYIVLWTVDSNGDDLPSPTEIRRIERDAATGELRSGKFVTPSGWSQGDIDAVDTPQALNINWDTYTTNLKEEAYFPVELWATGVSAWTIELNDADPQEATLVSYRVSLDAGTLTDTIVGAAALRN